MISWPHDEGPGIQKVRGTKEVALQAFSKILGEYRQYFRDSFSVIALLYIPS